MSLYRIKPKTKTCRCDAYKFPHRKGSGKCSGIDPETCTCPLPFVRHDAIDPPEPTHNRDCPIHGI